MNAIEKLMNAIRFNDEFSSTWVNDNMCRYTSNKTYSHNGRYFNIVLVVQYNKVLTTAFIADTFSKKMINLIGDFLSDEPESICAEFNLFDIDDEFITLLFGEQ